MIHQVRLRILRGIAFVLVMLCGQALSAQAQSLSITADHENGIYQKGESVDWRIRWSGGGVAPEAVSYVLKQGGLTEIGKGSLNLTQGEAHVIAKLNQPGTLLLEVKAKSAEAKEIRGLGGVVASPDEIRTSAKRPKDFDAFWKAKIEELNRVPAEPKIEPMDSGKPGVAYWHITMNNIRGTHIQGQLARPATGKKRPALLIVQWAGVYALQKNWVTDRANEGWLVLNIEAHDLPIDKPDAFYQEQSRGALRNYPAIGNEDRETSYFLRMYLSCYRGAQYLTECPDWDGKTLVVMGGSQGGLQSLVTAAIHPKITAALASVPAGCDTLGPTIGRSPGWPMWYWQTEGRDPKKVRETSRYFDVVNFASRIKCPVLIGAGLIDETCPPAGILAAYNQIRTPKEILLFPFGGHQDVNNSHGAYTKRCWGDWLPALRQGLPAPIITPASSEADLP